MFGLNCKTNKLKIWQKLILKFKIYLYYLLYSIHKINFTVLMIKKIKELFILLHFQINLRKSSIRDVASVKFDFYNGKNDFFAKHTWLVSRLPCRSIYHVRINVKLIILFKIGSKLLVIYFELYFYIASCI